MKAQDAYNTLEKFLAEHGAGLAETEALKSLAAFVKSICTRNGKQQRSVAIQLEMDQTSGQPALPAQQSSQPMSNQPAPMPPKMTQPSQQHTDLKKPQGNAKGKPWTPAEEWQLKVEFQSGLHGSLIAENHGRTIEAVAARLQVLRLIKHRDELPGYTEYRDKIARQHGGRYFPGQYEHKKKG